MKIPERPRPRLPRRPLPKPTLVEWMLLAIPPVIVSVTIWRDIDSMGISQLIASITLGLFLMLLGWGLLQIRKDKQKQTRK